MAFRTNGGCMKPISLKCLLQDCRKAYTLINGEWVIAKPENYKKQFLSVMTRIKWCFAIIRCKAIAVSYPEDER